MKVRDVVLRLQAALPRETYELTDNLVVISASHALGVAQVGTAQAHGLQTGDVAIFGGVDTPIPITDVQVDADTFQATLTTARPHDVTENDFRRETIELTGSGGSHDGDWPLVAAPNRRTIVVQMDGAYASGAVAGLTVRNAELRGNRLEGAFSVSDVLDANNFRVQLPSHITSLGTLLIDRATLRVKPRITATMDEATAEAAYSEVAETGRAQTWVYAFAGDAVVSRDRSTGIDAQDMQALSGDWRSWIVMGLSILVAIPIEDTEQGESVADRVHALRLPLLRTLLGYDLPTGLSVAGRPLQYRGDAPASTGSEHGVYWHLFEFEQSVQISRLDTIQPEDDVAFRDLELRLTPDTGTDADEPAVATIDLDDEPLGTP